MKKMCKNCLHYKICVNKHDHPISNQTLGCGLWENGIRFEFEGCSDLEETATLMISDDYKERLKAEYWQTKIRYERLKAFNSKIEAAIATSGFLSDVRKIEMPKHDCPADLLRNQQRAMGEYLHILEVRAVIEGIDLDEVSYNA